MQFGKLTPISYGPHYTRNGTEKLMWKCLCACGNTCFIRSNELTKSVRFDCKECAKSRLSKKRTLPEKLSTLRRTIRNYKNHAKKRKQKYNLTEKEFQNIIESPCKYCGSPPKEYADGYKRNGIDRVDSSIGYVKNNTVPCCDICNRAKLDHDLKFFKDWVKKIYAHLNHE